MLKPSGSLMVETSIFPLNIFGMGGFIFPQ
jgi:hypothetical protein